jgi:Mlc titration factor MtfA (ptsG expression regulator)
MPIIVLTIVVLGLGYWLYRRRAKAQLRKDWLATPLTEHERAIVHEQVPLVRTLPDHLQQKLEGKINLFLSEFDFYGYNGLEITEEIELSIAAQACILVMNTDAWFDHLTNVMVYPGAFRAKQAHHDGYVVTEVNETRSGESWSRGPVILSWDCVVQGAANGRDGHNVVFHEFAHQLDDLTGHTNGVPILGKDQTFTRWERVILDAFDRHVANTERGRKTAMDPYGAENHQEFFAVAIETFFEKPERFKKEEPQVYAELSKLLRLDPLEWTK